MRLKNWDYGQNCSYFITICVANRLNLFGSIQDNVMNLNALGEIVETICKEIEQKFQFTILNSFVIMPNHFYGIITIKKDRTDIENDVDIRKYFMNFDKGGFANHKNPMFHQNLSRIIRWFKGRVTSEIRKTNSEFSWQSGYHDQIIKDEKSMSKIKNYIKNNPKHWKDDQFYLN